MSKIPRIALFPALLLASLVVVAPALAADLVRLEKPGTYDLQMVGFTLDRDASINIDAVGRWSRDEGRSWNWSWGDDDDYDVLDAYAWILDSSTREPVWVMHPDDTDRFGRSRTLREVNDEVDLPAGDYELYYFSGHLWWEHWSGKDDDDDSWFQSRRHRREREEIEEDLAECYVQLSSDDVSRVSTFDPTGELPGALVRLTGLGDGEVQRAAFSLDRRMELRIYALKEHPDGSMDAADFGWIVDLDNGDRVFDMSLRRNKSAGGGSKNRLVDKTIALPEGRYMLVYGTDDSHSLAGFNTNPPFDPLNWGVTLLPGDDFDRGSFSTFDAPGRGEPMLDFSRARDEDLFEQAFQLDRDGTIHVVSMGEAVDDGWYFVDYGWIADASTGETVWEMTDRNTVPAGGAEKNRMFDGPVSLDAGEYVAFYITDDSHSYEDWNAAAPFDPEGWGLRIYPGSLDEDDFRTLARDEVARETGILAQLVRVGDGERERERFTLDRETRVEIYALGEGTGGDMYDYGWIRNRDTRRVVWEMEYRDTSHAGGAHKNRMIRDTLTLDAGEYEVIYVTDGSHSFQDWNDRRPDDPLNWGITVRVDE